MRFGTRNLNISVKHGAQRFNVNFRNTDLQNIDRQNAEKSKCHILSGLYIVFTDQPDSQLHALGSSLTGHLFSHS
jgi:hypothetical protein